MASIQKTHLTKVQKPPAKKPERVQKTPIKKAQLLEAPETLRPEEIRAAQQEVGNEVVQRALDKSARRNGLTDEQGNLRRDLSDQIQQKRGGGAPLPAKIQQEAAEKLGHKFSDVHIHTDESADKLSRTIHSRAFTIGKDIFFKNGVFNPASTSSRETIMHELTHVVQQSGRGSAGSKLKLGAPDTAHEKEADQVGKKFSSNVSTGSAHATVQARGEEEELLQGQPEEEELLQGQPENVVQRGPEEEGLLQGQPENVVQRGPEEEELLQGQPENVVQRDGPEDDDEESPGVPKAPPMTPKMQKENLLSAAKQIWDKPKKPTFGQKIQSGLASAKRSLQTEITGVDPESMKGKLQAKKENLKHVPGGLKKIERGRQAKLKELQHTPETADKDGKLTRLPSATEKRVSSREKLMSTISNASSKPEDVKAAQEKLGMLHHRSFKDKVKGFFTKGGTSKDYAEQASDLRKKNLLKAAQGGDEEAFKQLKEMKAEKSKNSTWGKLKGALGGIVGKVGGMIGGAVGGVAKTQVAEYKSHFMGGGKKEDEEKGDKKGDKGDEKGSDTEDSGKSSSNSNAGIGAMMEKYGELVKENMTLKQKIAELEKAK